MVLVTGANGFIGKAFVRECSIVGQPVVAAVRQLPSRIPIADPNVNWRAVGEISRETNWRSALQGVRTVVHCAARVHVANAKVDGGLASYREVNVAGTRRLAEHSAAAGVKRFVFISSIGVNGSRSVLPFTECGVPEPHNAYALSKLEAEYALLAVAAETGMEVVIIRPPLVYGPEAPGSFASLIKWVQRGLPLPLGSVDNRRSLVGIDNLLSLLFLCADRSRSPQAANHVFLVADDEDLSTAELLRRMGRALGKPARLVSVPQKLFETCLILLGEKAVAQSLCGNLQVNASKVREVLGWRPPFTVDEELMTIAMYYQRK